MDGQQPETGGQTTRSSDLAFDGFEIGCARQGHAARQAVCRHAHTHAALNHGQQGALAQCQRSEAPLGAASREGIGGGRDHHGDVWGVRTACTLEKGQSAS
jgi:hypothetical protein